MNRGFRLATLCQNIVLLTAVSMLAACGSSPTVRYYTLEALETGYDTVQDGAPRLGIGPFRMPDYLTRSKIVTRGADASAKIDDFHRWIEPVSDALHTIVATNVDSMTTDVIAVAFPYRFLDQTEMRVVGRIERFDSNHRGEVELVVQWGITSYNSDFIITPQRRIYRSQASSPDDYNAIANAMSDALRLFSRDITDAFLSIDQD